MTDPSIVGKEIGRISFPIDPSKLAEPPKTSGDHDPTRYDAHAATAAGFDSVPVPPTGTALMADTEDGLSLDAATLCEAFQRTARSHADAPALRRVGDETAITWREYAARVEQLAGALAGLGIRRGETVAMLTSNRPETHLIDMACVHIGAIPFNLYPTSTPEQLEYLVGHSGARIVITEAALAPRLATVLERLEMLEDVFVLDGSAPAMRSFEELVATPAPKRFDFEAEWRAATPEDVITLIYTSGTTGPPKGVEITHANMLGTFRGYHQVVPYSVRG
jgi:long-chain acyl-CoA synthetase